ncbi:RDD family protein [Streptomyces sp. NPDC059010]|uniref:RDD family protein n=1 Tax=Streptomyces sp. NPDC059010 TaxID=3346695 RepID=UPI0036918746
MSAPTPAPGDDRPREGYYPDPSIPGYVRYWNGASWVPGTSRPAPTDGETLSPPPGSQPAAAAPAAPVEETGPHFFDEEPADGPAASDPRHGSRPESASAWGADPAHQSGFGGEQDHRVSWGAQQGAEPAGPRDPRTAARADGAVDTPPAEPDADAQGLASGNTFMMRRPTAGSGASGQATPHIPSPAGPGADAGTMAIRALSPRTGQQSGAAGAQAGSTGASAGPGAAHPDAGARSSAGAPQGPGFGAGKAAADRASVAQAGAQQGAQGAAGAPAAGAAATGLPGPQQASPSVPQQSGPPMSSGQGGGQSSWAQQVHRLAGDDQPVAPWKPVREDPFAAAALRQAAARPANLGKRLAARLLDTVVLAAVTAVAAVPLGTKAIDHVNEKIDAAKLSGETVTVWLLDGTTSVYLGIIVAVLLLFGLAYEALPTAKWGRTLGKKLFGLEVRDIEAHEPPEFGAALRRWLVYSIPGLLGIGVVGVLWCLFDRPWHQCWHDKAARTFVAG